MDAPLRLCPSAYVLRLAPANSSARLGEEALEQELGRARDVAGLHLVVRRAPALRALERRPGARHHLLLLPNATCRAKDLKTTGRSHKEHTPETEQNGHAEREREREREREKESNATLP